MTKRDCNPSISRRNALMAVAGAAALPAAALANRPDAELLALKDELERRWQTWWDAFGPAMDAITDAETEVVRLSSRARPHMAMSDEEFQAWWKLSYDVRERYDVEAFNSVVREAWPPLEEICRRILDMPASTLEGVAVKARAVAVLKHIPSLGRVSNVMDFGATGNGVSDDYPAFAAAFTALQTAGGGTLYLPVGTYNFVTGALTPPSNVIVQGAGIDATIIKNTALFPNSTTIQIPMVMSGTPANSWSSVNTTYPINAPTLGGATVTTTNAADAGNFSPGGIIFISGGLHSTSFWYPGWYTTVVSANASTGVITLAETLPIGGSQLTTVQKILSLPQNITVRDMTVVSGQSAAVECQGGKNFLFENLKIIPGSFGNSSADFTFGIHRNSVIRNIRCEQGANPIELFVSSDCTIESCDVLNGYILVDGGSFDCNVLNNNVKDPQNNGSAFHGIHIPDYCSRVRVIGNKVTGMHGSFGGINMVAVPDENRDHVVVGNTIIGVNTSSSNGINTANGLVVGNLLINLQNGIQMNNATTVTIEGNYFDTVRNQILPFSGGGSWRSRQNPNLKAMTSGASSPNVTGGVVYQLFQSGAFNVTGFTGGLPGDEISVCTGDANTTFVNGKLQMKGGVNYNPPSNTVMSFICLTGGGLWIEKSRSQ
jgi:polygalacturonase